jgi:hypothetical protein
MKRGAQDLRSRGSQIVADHPEGPGRHSLTTRGAVVAHRALWRVKQACPRAFVHLTGAEIEAIREALALEYAIATSPPDPVENTGRPRRE